MSNLLIIDAIKQVIEGKSLFQDQAYEVCLDIMKGNATPSQISSLLTALRIKGESIDEITGFARAMRDLMTKIDYKNDYLIDTCGTGGDGSDTFNISTTAALIAAAAGCYVAKHGNRSFSSKCGSADVLAGLGIEIEMSPEIVKDCLDKNNFAFIFAPLYHPAMKSVALPRKEIGIRTIFNLLGPLCNPASVKRQVIGVCKKELLPLIAEVLKNLNTEHSLVVHGADGLDEITTTTYTYVYEINRGSIRDYTISPDDFGLGFSKPEELKVIGLKDSVESILKVLKGNRSAKTDVAVMNAGAAIYISGLAESISIGVEIARGIIESGTALKKVEDLRDYPNQERPLKK